MRRPTLRERLGGPLGLAGRYLLHHRGRAGIQVLGSSVALALPAITLLANATIEDRLLARAQASPIVLGHVGNTFDLTMSALYFRTAVRDPIPHGVVDRASAYGLAAPLHVGHSVGGVPLVGTSLAYLEARGLQIAQGRRPGVLGEVVAGAALAEASGLSIGDRVRTDLTNLYDLAGSYPLILTVVGILSPTGGPDDRVYFSDVKTTWAVDGHLHGHAALTEATAFPAEEGARHLQATAALFLEQQITPETLASFHLHGETHALPASAVLVFPTDARARDQLLGDFALEPLYQAVQPTDVIRTVLGIVAQVRGALLVYLGLVITTTTLFLGLTLTLSLRLRRAELELLRRLGSSRLAVAEVIGAEIVLILGGAVALSGGLTLLAALLLGVV